MLSMAYRIAVLTICKVLGGLFQLSYTVHELDNAQGKGMAEGRPGHALP